MWAMISSVLLRIAALRWLFKLGGLGLLVPIAFLLKMIGLPVLLVLAVIAIPMLMLLFVFGLPIFLVLIVGGMAVGLLGVVLTIGVVALKAAIFIVLPVWAIWKLASMLFRRGGDDPGAPRPNASPRPAPATDPLEGLDPS